jgi:hypothetical protein
MSFGINRISAKTRESRQGRMVSKTFNGLVGESVDAQSVSAGGNRLTTHTGGTDSPTEEWPAFRAWVQQGLERSGRPPGPGCACEECRQHREPGALHAPGAE